MNNATGFHKFQYPKCHCNTYIISIKQNDIYKTYKKHGIIACIFDY